MVQERTKGSSNGPSQSKEMTKGSAVEKGASSNNNNLSNNNNNSSGNRKNGKSWRKAVQDDNTHDDENASSTVSDLSNSSQDDARDHLGSIDEHSEDYRHFEKSLRRKHTRACKAMSTGAYQNALSDFEAILSELLARYGERHERVGAALHNVAIANLRAGSLDDAMDAIEEAIKIRSRALGRSHPKVADSLVELGIILLSMDEHDDALKVFERALKLRREELEELSAAEDMEECNLKIAKVLNNIGCVNFERGFFEPAQAAFDEAIKLQMAVFKNIFSLLCGMDASSPGILTMASTMCNRAYIDIELDRYEQAISLFSQSLDIQRKVLGTDNKLVQSSLDNIGYAYAMVGQNEKALKAFDEVWEAIKDANDSSRDEKIALVRKIAICHVRLERWAQAFEYLEILEDLQREADPDSKELRATEKLLGEVNYQILKLPSLSNATNKALGCPVCMGQTEEEVNMDAWRFEKPENTSKMSGHRVTHA